MLKPVEDQLVESQLLILNQIMLLVQDELDHPSADALASASWKELGSSTVIENVKKEILFSFLPISLPPHLSDEFISKTTGLAKMMDEISFGTYRKTLDDKCRLIAGAEMFFELLANLGQKTTPSAILATHPIYFSIQKTADFGLQEFSMILEDLKYAMRLLIVVNREVHFSKNPYYGDTWIQVGQGPKLIFEQSTSLRNMILYRLKLVEKYLLRANNPSGNYKDEAQIKFLAGYKNLSELLVFALKVVNKA